jgi:Zn finger protein HypA/HybF involved in hydrogenase expression
MTGLSLDFCPEAACYCLQCHREADIDELHEHGGTIARKLGDRHEVELPDDATWACEQCGGRRFVVRFSW